MLITSIVGPAVAQSSGYPLNPEASEHPDTYIAEDQLTVESHDRETMDWLEFENDNGEIQRVKAQVNGTTNSSAQVGYRLDRLQEEELNQYPRRDAESNNSATWTNVSGWSTSVSDTTNTALSVTDADGSTASGVVAINYATGGSMGSGDTATATYTNQSITSDAQKRYLQLVLNVNTLDSAAEVGVQAVDGDGDYVEAVINSSRDATATDVIANQTASGVAYQEQLGQLSVQGSGDGSLDGIQKIKIVTSDADADVTITGMNVQKKSTWDFGSERVLDTSTSDSDDYTNQEVISRPMGGEINATSLEPMGDTFADSVVHKLHYWDVHYALEDKPSAVNVTWGAAENYPNFPASLQITWNRTIPTAYDLGHGSMTLETKQSFLSDRYVQLRYAEGVGDKNASEVSDSTWIDLTGSLGEEGKKITADSSVQADTTYLVQIKANVLEDQKSNLQAAQGGAGGFWGGSGGGANPFSSLVNWIAGGVVGLLGMFGLRRKMGA